MPPPYARVYIVRHGETEENRKAIIQGQRDTPLSDTGRAQARALAHALRDMPLERAWSSDLARASEVFVCTPRAAAVVENGCAALCRLRPRS